MIYGALWSELRELRDEHINMNGIGIQGQSRGFKNNNNSPDGRGRFL